jgi:hypothetical protein
MQLGKYVLAGLLFFACLYVLLNKVGVNKKIVDGHKVQKSISKNINVNINDGVSKKPQAEAISVVKELSDIDWLAREEQKNISYPEVRNSVKRYALALNDFRENTGHRSLELLYHIGLRAARELTYVVEHMDEADFVRVEKKMEGFSLNRDKLFEVTPRAEFFSELAETQGGQSDQAFFQSLKKYQTEDQPNFQKRVTEFVACVRFGEGTLVRAYDYWLDYQKNNPHHYVSDVNSKTDEIAKILTNDNCACGGKNDVFSEFKLFIKGHHRSRLAENLKTKMDALEREPANFRYNCKSNSEIEY